MKRILFKFDEETRPDDRERVIKELPEASRLTVDRVFPDDDDPELASLYKVDGGDDVDATSVLEHLAESVEVEFAEEEISRELAAEPPSPPVTPRVRRRGIRPV